MEVSGQLHTPVALSPNERKPVHTEQRAGRAPEPVWTFRRIETVVAPARYRTTFLGLPVCRLVTILTELPRLLYSYIFTAQYETDSFSN